MVIVVGDLQDAWRKGKLEILRTVYLLKQEYALGKLKGGENQASLSLTTDRARDPKLLQTIKYSTSIFIPNEAGTIAHLWVWLGPGSP